MAETYKESEHVNVDVLYAPGVAIRVPEVRQPYMYDVNLASDQSGLDCSRLQSRTQQSFAEEVDINTIVKRFGLTGELPQNVPMLLQGDFTNVVDFQSAMDMVVAAREAFMEQPADVRARFHNDPQEFLDFVSSKENVDEAIKLGLVREESVKQRAKMLEEARKQEIDKAVAVELEARKRAAEAAKAQDST